MLFKTLPPAVRGISRPVKSELGQALDMIATMPATARVEERDLLGYQPFVSSSFSDDEVFRMTGTLPADRIDHLINLQSNREQLQNIDGYLYEASAQMATEDFMSDARKALATALSMLKEGSSSHRALLKGLEILDEQVKAHVEACEYGRDELRKATRVLIDADLAFDYEKRDRENKAKACAAA